MPTIVGDIVGPNELLRGEGSATAARPAKHRWSTRQVRQGQGQWFEGQQAQEGRPERVDNLRRKRVK